MARKRILKGVKSEPETKKAKLVNGVKHSPLTLAIASENCERIKELLDKGANPNEPGLNGHPHIHGATSRDNAEIIKLLIKYGANVDATNSSQETALHLASSKGKLNCLKVLLSCGANIDSTDNIGNTPLNEATYMRNIEIMETLILIVELILKRKTKMEIHLSIMLQTDNKLKL